MSRPVISSRPETEAKAKAPVRLEDPDAVATRLGVTREYVRRLAREGRIPSFKVGKFLRFDHDEIEQWIERNRREAS